MTAIEWHSFVDKPNTEHMLHCPNTLDGSKAYYIQACTQRIPALFENTRHETVHSYIYRVHLRPPIIFHNVLPIAIEVTQPRCMAVRLLAGETSALHHLGERGLDDENGVHLVIRAYGDGKCTWQGDLRVSRCVLQMAVYVFVSLCRTMSELSVLQMSVVDASSTGIQERLINMTFGVHISHQRGNIDISLYAPFWMVNKTGLHLTYRVSWLHAQIISCFEGRFWRLNYGCLVFELMSTCGFCYYCCNWLFVGI